MRRPSTALPPHNAPATPTSSGAPITTSRADGAVIGAMTPAKVNRWIASQARVTNRPPSSPGMATAGRRSSTLAARV